MERLKENIFTIVIVVFCVVIGVFFAFNIVNVSIKGGETEDKPQIIDKNQQIEIRVNILKGEYFSNFYYYWDDPANKIDLEKSMFTAKGITKVPNTPGIHKLVIVRGAFGTEVKSYYKVSNEELY